MCPNLQFKINWWCAFRVHVDHLFPSNKEGARHVAANAKSRRTHVKLLPSRCCQPHWTWRMHTFMSQSWLIETLGKKSCGQGSPRSPPNKECNLLHCLEAGDLKLLQAEACMYEPMNAKIVWKVSEAFLGSHLIKSKSSRVHALGTFLVVKDFKELTVGSSNCESWRKWEQLARVSIGQWAMTGIIRSGTLSIVSWWLRPESGSASADGFFLGTPRQGSKFVLSFAAE